MNQNNGNPSTHDDGHEGWKQKTALFLSSQGLSMFGSMLVQYAIIWHITLTTQSGSLLTISTLVGFLPQIVLSLFAGVWADRYHRKKLIIGADLLTASSTLVLALFFLFGYRELWLIFVVSAVRSVGAGIQAPAVNAFLPQIVPGDRLMRVNSVNNTIQPFIMILSPVLAGALLSYARIESIFFIDVLTAALAVGLLLALHVPPHRRAQTALTTSYLDDLRAGLAYVRGNTIVKTLFVFFAFMFFLMTPVIFLTPLLVARSFGEEVWRLTANEITFFVGSILGGGLMALWGGFDNRFRTIGLGCILWAVLFAGLGLAQDFSLYLVLMFLAGIPMPFFSATTTTLLQETVRPDMHGRVFGLHGLIANTIMPLGMLIFGPLSDRIAIEWLLVAASALLAIPGLVIFFRQPLPAQSEDYDLQTGD